MEPTFAHIQYFEQISSITTENFYVLDVMQKKICYIKSDDLFLCGFSTNDVLRLGYDFYAEVIYSDDLPLWINIYELVLGYLKDIEETQDEIDYFSCTFRLKRTYSFSPKPLLQMVYHRMKPVWVDNNLRYLVCCIESSTLVEAGNLCMHYRDGSVYSEYNFITKRWNQKVKESLTERERAILMLAQQGKRSFEIAIDLCKGHNTIRNQIKSLYAKLKVHSMQEAIELARKFCMIYPKGSTGVKKT